MANRLFLTLLALLTGLAAQVAPVQARVSGRDAEVGAVMSATEVQRQATTAVKLMAALRTGDRLPREWPMPVEPALVRDAPAVRIGIDRARE